MCPPCKLLLRFYSAPRATENYSACKKELASTFSLLLAARLAETSLRHRTHHQSASFEKTNSQYYRRRWKRLWHQFHKDHESFRGPQRTAPPCSCS
ncbi:unnamed protein product [Ixodes pacificus]